MPKEMFQDVVPQGRKSIRRIPLRENKKQESHIFFDAPAEEEQEHRPEAHRPHKKPNSRFSKILLAVFGGAALLAFGVFLFSSLLSRAKIAVTIHQVESVVDTDFKASLKANGDELPYEVVVVSETFKKTIAATKEEIVKKKASGKVVIYNNYNGTPQRLIRNTRLATPTGLIYRIDASVVVPGKSVVQGKAIPGSVEVIAYADAVGEEYNVGLTDFTIPGFKGDPRFAGFYARSKTEMTGGFNGKMKVVSEADRALIKQKIETEGILTLTKKVKDEIKDDVVLFPKAYKIAFTTLGDISPDSSSVEISEKGTLQAFVFNKQALSSFIAKNTMKDFDGSPVILKNFDEITFDWKALDPKKPLETDIISFHLKGKAQISWILDITKVKETIAGKARKDIQNILANYKAIDKAQVTMTPFWRQSFPSDSAKITIETN